MMAFNTVSQELVASQTEKLEIQELGKINSTGKIKKFLVSHKKAIAQHL